MEELELDVWKNDWGLPSVDVECLQVLAYAKFNGIPIKVNTSGNPYNTPHEKQWNSETELNATECALILAYNELLKEKLLPALQFIWWIDKKNVDELIRPWYSKALPFPLNFYYPGKFERQSRALFECLYPTEDNITDIENKVYSEARKCLTLLSTRLEDSKHYFFGDKPTMIDAILYSYLAPLLKISLPNSALQNHLKACTNLVKYVSRISQKYFEKDCQEYEQRKAEENSNKVRRDSETDFPNKRRNQFFAGIFATLAMAAYAISTGIVQSSTHEKQTKHYIRSRQRIRDRNQRAQKNGGIDP
ncbi:metaxin-1 isoform X5 [Augochlora pura]